MLGAVGETAAQAREAGTAPGWPFLSPNQEVSTLPSLSTNSLDWTSTASSTYLDGFGVHFL